MVVFGEKEIMFEKFSSLEQCDGDGDGVSMRKLVEKHERQ